MTTKVNRLPCIGDRLREEGITSRLLTDEESFEGIKYMRERMKNVRRDILRKLRSSEMHAAKVFLTA